MSTAKPDTWMPMYWADYWKDTGHLSVAAHGAYLNLVGACWVRGGSLPADDESLSRLAKATPAEWRKLKPSVATFFQIHPTEWRNKRVDLEIANTAKIVKARSEAGAKGNAKRWEDHRKGIANGSQIDPPSPSHIDIKYLTSEKIPREDARGGGPNYAKREVRRQRHEQKVINEIIRVHDQESGTAIVAAYLKGEPEGKRVFDAVYRAMKGVRP